MIETVIKFALYAVLTGVGITLCTLITFVWYVFATVTNLTP